MRLPWATIDWRQACDDFAQEADVEKRLEIEGMFAEKYVVGSVSCDRVIACSLFCRPADLGPKWEEPTAESVHTIRVRGGRKSWWEAYAAPLLDNLYGMSYTLPEFNVHLYLAADLEWLVETLALPRVVIHVMQNSSLASQPGAMWRFLAHDLPGVAEVATFDAEDDWKSMLRRPCIAEWRRSGLAFFRHINPSETSEHHPGVSIYRAVMAGLFLYRPQSDFVMRDACQAYALMAMQRQIPTKLQHPLLGEQTIFGTEWPNYDLEESLLQQLVYPFFINRGVHTNFSESLSSILFPLDLHATFAAHRSAVVSRGF